LVAVKSIQGNGQSSTFKWLLTLDPLNKPDKRNGSKKDAMRWLTGYTHLE